MKRKSMIVAMVMLAAILIASPVLAAGPGHPIEVAKQQPTIISMTATIKAIEGTQIYVLIRMTNRAFIQYRGDYMWVLTDTATTRYYIWDGTTRKPYSFADLEVGDKVSINARLNLNTKDFTARRVQVNQPRIPQ